MQYNQIERYITLGKNIAFYRKAKGYTQEKLAELAQTSRTHIGRIETADCAVSLDIVYNIADALEVAPYKLFQSTEDKELLARASSGQAFAKRAGLDLAHCSEAELLLIADIGEGVLRYLRNQ